MENSRKLPPGVAYIKESTSKPYRARITKKGVSYTRRFRTAEEAGEWYWNIKKDREDPPEKKKLPVGAGVSLIGAYRKLEVGTEAGLYRVIGEPHYFKSRMYYYPVECLKCGKKLDRYPNRFAFPHARCRAFNDQPSAWNGGRRSELLKNKLAKFTPEKKEIKLSNFIATTKHPDTGNWEDAFWMDNTFGSHGYGVVFKDGSLYDPRSAHIESRNSAGDTTWEEYPESVVFREAGKPLPKPEPVKVFDTHEYDTEGLSEDDPDYSMLYRMRMKTTGGMSLSKVARLIGTHQSSMSRYENGRELVPTKLVRPLSELYGVSVNELVEASFQAYDEAHRNENGN